MDWELSKSRKSVLNLSGAGLHLIIEISIICETIRQVKSQSLGFYDKTLDNVVAFI